jgi:hypothetical protein
VSVRWLLVAGLMLTAAGRGAEAQRVPTQPTRPGQSPFGAAPRDTSRRNGNA